MYISHSSKMPGQLGDELKWEEQIICNEKVPKQTILYRVCSVFLCLNYFVLACKKDRIGPNLTITNRLHARSMQGSVTAVRAKDKITKMILELLFIDLMITHK